MGRDWWASARAEPHCAGRRRDRRGLHLRCQDTARFCSIWALPGACGVRRTVSPEEKPILCSEGENVGLTEKWRQVAISLKARGLRPNASCADEENHVQSVCRAPGRGLVRTRPLRPGLGTQVGVDLDLAQVSTQRLAPAHAGLKSTECLPHARPVLTGKEGRMCAKVSSSEKPLALPAGCVHGGPAGGKLLRPHAVSLLM